VLWRFSQVSGPQTPPGSDETQEPQGAYQYWLPLA
jgi:hypothetical protein